MEDISNLEKGYLQPIEIELLPVIFREKESTIANCYGFVSGVGGGLGNSALRMEATASETKIAVVDGVMSDDSKIMTPERLHAEIVAKNLAAPDKTVLQGLDQAESELGPSGGAEELRDPIFCAWAVLKVASAEGEKGGARVKAFGGGDVTAVALFDRGMDFAADRITPLYFNPTSDHNIDSIRSPRFHGLKTRELRVADEPILPSGTVILLADDGGMSLILHPWFLRELGTDESRLEEIVERASRPFSSFRPDEFDKDTMTAWLKTEMKPFFSVLSRLGCRSTIDSFMKLLNNRRGFIHDDVAMALVEVK